MQALRYHKMCMYTHVCVFSCATFCVGHIQCSCGDAEHTTLMEPTISLCLSAHSKTVITSLSVALWGTCFPSRLNEIQEREAYSSLLNHRNSIWIAWLIRITLWMLRQPGGYEGITLENNVVWKWTYVGMLFSRDMNV